jgi:prephenate dehydrogenase
VGYRVQTADARVNPGTYATDIVSVCRSPTVIYAVPIRSFEAVVMETRTLIEPGTVVMDVCSVKVMPCDTLARCFPAVPTVGTHPLFGRESAPAQCAGQRIAICAPPPIAGSRLSGLAVGRAQEMASALGLTAVVCTPDEHDAQVARSQFLTHFIGRGAERCGIARVALSTKAHDDLMDIIDVVCHDSTELFEDMAAFNPMAAQVRREFLTALAGIDRELAEDRRS